MTDRTHQLARVPRYQPNGRVPRAAGGQGIRERLSAATTRWLARYSVTLLRISLGLVFLAFGLLKFFGLSPAQDLAERTMATLSFGLVAGGVAGVAVASLETAIGLCLVTGKFVRLGLALLAVAMVGILSPLVLFTGQLFSGPDHAPTLEGQYVLKDLVLLAGSLVVTARELGRRPLAEPDQPGGDDDRVAS